MKAGKIWGETRLLLATPTVEIHALCVLPHSFCSLHRHRSRWNAFIVTAGRLRVEVRQDAYDLTDLTVLSPGECATVPPGLWHRFTTDAEGAECLEVYYPDALGEADIERATVGGHEGGA